MIINVLEIFIFLHNKKILKCLDFKRYFTNFETSNGYQYHKPKVGLLLN
jgi:hypothetical protein